ncbi:MAG: TIGR01777 family oxidoreductase [Acidobacteriota bacterium]
MKIVISGSSGFLGNETKRAFSKLGYDVFSLVRRKPENEKEFYYNPSKKEIDKKVFDGVSAVINFAGESIYGIWTKSKKERIVSSRVETTRFLSDKINECAKGIIFISASATGFYGYENKKNLDEESPKGKGFLSDVCEMWENEALKAEESARVVIARFGVVLGKSGGMIKKILPLTRLGFFGRIGDGNQYFSWIALEEIPKIIEFLLKNSEVNGAVNCVAPQETKNKDFSESLAKTLGRKEIFVAPAFPFKIFGGEMAKEMALGGAGVIPKKLLESGYKFSFPDLETCLKSIFINN